MFRWMGAWWHKIMGVFGRKADRMAYDADVMSSMYDASIKKRTHNFETVADAVNEMKAIRNKTVKDIKTCEESEHQLSLAQEGARIKMKQRSAAIIDKAKAEGIQDSDAIKGMIALDPEFLQHKGVYDNVTSSVSDRREQLVRLRADLVQRNGALANYDLQLTKMRDDLKKLAAEKHDNVAKTQIARQMENINNTLAGLGLDNEDKDLVAVRKAAEQAAARAEMSGVLAGVDVNAAEQEYIRVAQSTSTDKELDKYLDLDQMIKGDDEQELEQRETVPLGPAELP